MDRIRIIVVGCGGNRGSWFLEQLAHHPMYQVVALVDGLPAAARVVAEHIGLNNLPIFQDTAEALVTVMCDAVLVATPDDQHTEPVACALRHGKYVYVEKPVAISLADCLKIVEADRAAGGRTMVGFNLRYAPVYQRIRQLIKAGAVGRILTIQADEFYYGGRTYFRRRNRLRSKGGGLWITKASHDFDLLYWMADARPVRVDAAARLTHYRPKPEASERCRDCILAADCCDAFARTDWSVNPLLCAIQEIRESAGEYPDLCLYNSDKDTFDHGMAIVEFDNDILATYTVNVVASFTDRRMIVAGTEGTIEGSLRTGELWYWRRHQGDDPNQREQITLGDPNQDTADGHGGADSGLLAGFAAFIDGKREGILGPAEASVAVAIGLAATRASDHNGSCALAELTGWDEIWAELGMKQ